MVLEFNDTSRLEVLTIIGGPKLINGVLRDTLEIEVDPSTINFDELKRQFKEEKVSKLYTYVDDVDEEGNAVQVRTEIGEDYTIFVSISDEERKIVQPPGKVVPDQYEEVYIVTIAQITYAEKLVKEIQASSN